ncbi:MAG: glycosyltransferase [Candidatus Nomurabacteria bacterium]|nr:glycosyltransferase [Candidatus Nomurabacteria bacterium]
MDWKYYNPKFEYEEKFEDSSWPWVGHKYFAYDLIENIKPEIVVELGTHYGTSFWSFSQAVKDQNLDTKLYAIDTWEGEKHSGFYGEEVFETVKKIKEDFYCNLKINLIRKRFNNALVEFKDNSIDILHIDGLHTYEAVKNDFQNWLPKIKQNGIILFHDVKVAENDFGVYKFWNELKVKYITVEFYQSFGLGILFLDKKLGKELKNNEEEWQIHYSYIHEIKKNNAIQQKKQQIQQKNTEINALYNSLSWRITFPLRYTKNKLKNFKKEVVDLNNLVKKGLFVLRKDGLFVFLEKCKIFILAYSNYVSTRYFIFFRKKSAEKKVSDFISVIIPIYDRTYELKESIESILNQTYKNLELILVTDGSPKETMSIVESYRNNPRVKIFHFYNNTGNAVRGRNKAIKEAKGEFIAFQDSDDIAELDRLEKSIEFIKKYNADVVYGGWRAKLDGTRQDTGLFDGQEKLFLPNYDFSMLKTTSISPNSIMVRKKTLDDVGGFKPIMQYREDHELWLRLAYFGYKFKAIPYILTNLRLHKGNNELNFKKDDEKWKALMLTEYFKKSVIVPKIFYVIPGTRISGGIAVILAHTNGLLKRGYDISLISQDNTTSINWFPNQRVPIIALKDITNPRKNYLFENIDILIATHWATFNTVINIDSKRKIYFIQSDERNFEESKKYKEAVNKTYKYNNQKIEYMTMANWIKRWQKKEFDNEVFYIPNGLDHNIFHPVVPIQPKNNKIRVLLEGSINLPFKGMAEAFGVVKDLDCEIWAVSSYGKPEPEWRCDKFFEKVNFFDMPAIYSSCDILLKMSTVESFAYPPLEMMACGGVPVILEVPGIEEYAKNGENCIIVKNANEAKETILKLMSDKKLYNNLREAGLKTAKNFSWESSIDSLERIVTNQ